MEIEEDVEAQQQQEQEEEPSRKLQRLSEEARMRDWNNPSSRIVRVSRASGGKDRHSKVLTSKGLRDRRIRLSVATAIQFYDLQDRLGFDQPSKAVEWLINAAADSISDLPSINTDFTSESSLLSLSKTTKRKARERTSTAKDLQNAQSSSSSFTQLLTRGFDQPSSDCFEPVQLIPTRTNSSLSQFTNNHFSLLPNYNFGISSSDSPGGCYTTRGTLQSNSQSLFLNNQRSSSSSSPMDSPSISFPPPLDHHLDGRLYLYYGDGNRTNSDDKGKGR